MFFSTIDANEYKWTRLWHQHFSQSSLLHPLSDMKWKLDKKFSSQCIFYNNLFLFYRMYLAFWYFCILLISPIVSSTTFSFVLYKSPLSMFFTQSIHQKECNSANFALYISSEKCFFCFVKFDVHVATTDVTVFLGLVSMSLLSEAPLAATEYLSINLKQYIPPCSLTYSICIDFTRAEAIEPSNRPRKEQKNQDCFLPLPRKKLNFFLTVSVKILKNNVLLPCNQ